MVCNLLFSEHDSHLARVLPFPTTSCRGHAVRVMACRRNLWPRFPHLARVLPFPTTLACPRNLWPRFPRLPTFGPGDHALIQPRIRHSSRDQHVNDSDARIQQRGRRHIRGSRRTSSHHRSVTRSGLRPGLSAMAAPAGPQPPRAPAVRVICHPMGWSGGSRIRASGNTGRPASLPMARARSAA